MCRSRRELSNAYLLAKFGFDAAENEPCKVCPTGATAGGGGDARDAVQDVAEAWVLAQLLELFQRDHAVLLTIVMGGNQFLQCCQPLLKLFLFNNAFEPMFGLTQSI